MELRKLTANDFDELLNMLNIVFARRHGREMDFLNELPKMWVLESEKSPTLTH